MVDENQPTGGIFISYRRADSSGWVVNLAERLRREFDGRAVFLDLTGIEAGEEFPDAIDEAIDKSAAMLVVIGPRWLENRPDGAQPRLFEPTDYVRGEIRNALTSGIRVVPVLVGGAALPTREQIPEDLSDLLNRNAFEISDSRLDFDSNRLVATLQSIVGAPPPQRLRSRRAALFGGIATAALVAVLGIVGTGAVSFWRTDAAVQTPIASAVPTPNQASVVTPLAEVAPVVEVTSSALENDDLPIGLSAQELVDRLRIGMGLDDIAEVLGSRPVAEEILERESELAGETIGRALFVSSDHELAVTVLLDGRATTIALAVTALRAETQIGFPLGNTGDIAYGKPGTERFLTHKTRLDQIPCNGSSNPFGRGASWGYFALGCSGYGANNFDANGVAVNWAAEGISPGLGRVDLAEQLQLTTPSPDVAAITFNTVIWAEEDASFPAFSFGDLIETYSFGPGRGDPLE